MDHQVEDHTYLRATGVELGEPVHFYEHRRKLVAAEGKIRRIEALHMPYLYFDAGLFGKLYYLMRLLHSICKRLLHKYMPAVAYGFLTKIKMKGGRSDNVHRIAGCYKLVLVIKSFKPVLF